MTEDEESAGPIAGDTRSEAAKTEHGGETRQPLSHPRRAQIVMLGPKGARHGGFLHGAWIIGPKGIAPFCQPMGGIDD